MKIKKGEYIVKVVRKKNQREISGCSLFHLMRAIVRAHASTCATSLMRVKNSKHHLGL